MIRCCPNCGGKLKQSGGVKLCTECEGKYYILETHEPKKEVTLDSQEIQEINNLNLKDNDSQTNPQQSNS